MQPRANCMQDTFARATHPAYAAARPSARATIGYLVYKRANSGIQRISKPLLKNRNSVFFQNHIISHQLVLNITQCTAF